MDPRRVVMIKKEVEKYIPLLSFPQHLRKVNMDETKMKFFNLINQLNIFIPLLDALTRILHMQSS